MAGTSKADHDISGATVTFNSPSVVHAAVALTSAGRLARRHSRLGASTCLGGTVLVVFLLLSGCVDDDQQSGSAPRIDRPIAFASNRAGGYDIWLMRVDGSRPVRLTRSPLAELTPAWSPDGSRLAFSASRAEEAPFDIIVVNADGTGRRNLTRTASVSEAAPRWSPDGKRLVYTTDSGLSGRVAVMDSDGTQRRELVEGEWPDWAPDGQRIVYTRTEDDHQQVWLMNHDGSHQVRITEDGFEASWSPDGALIAYATSRHGQPTATDPALWNEEIYVMAPDGARQRRLTNRPGNDHWPPAWSPDSTRLLVTSDGLDKNHPQGHGEIVLLEIATGETRRLTTNPSDDSFPAWRGTR